MANRWENNGNTDRLFGRGPPKSLLMVTAAMKLTCLFLGRKAMTNVASVLKSRDITLPTKVHLVKTIIFPVVTYGYESWIIKKCWRIDAFKLWCWRRLLHPLDCKEIKPVNPKENQPRIFIGRTDAEAEVPILSPSDAKSWLIGKEPGAGKEWRQEEGTTENEIVGWHHQLNGPKFEQTPGDCEGQGSLVCCSPWSHKESDTTEWLNNSNTNYFLKVTWKMTVKSSSSCYFFSGILEIEGNA